MSFNIATRLNNLQYQINQKAGNPLTTDLDCDNNSIIDCKTLHYTALDPPVATSTSTIEEILQTGDDAGGENIQNVGTISLAQQNFQDLDLVNQDVVISQLSGLGNRLNVYMASDTTSPFSSSATLATGQLITTSGITCNGTCSVAGGMNVGSAQVPSNITLDGALVINQDGAPTGSTTLSATAGNELSVSGGITTTGNITCSQLNYTTLNPAVATPNLSTVLTAGSNAGGNSITNVNQLTVGQLNYTTLNPPVSSGTQNLSQVLTTGNDATGQNITNVGNLFTGSVQGVGATGKFQIGNSPSNFYANNDGSGNRTLVLGDCITNFANSGLVLNLNDPVFSSSPATKNYVDTNIATRALTSSVPYSLWYPLGSGGAGAQTIPATSGGSGAYSFLWFSPAIPTNGRNLRVNVQLSNTESAGGTFANVLESHILVSPDGNPLTYTTQNMNPWNQVPPARGFFWSPNFNAWFNIDTGLIGFNPLPATFYVAIAVRQSLVGSGYVFNGSDVLLTVYPL